MQTFLTTSEAETEGVAATLARRLRAGDVVLLVGDLGAGKTVFVRGLATGLEADPEEVSSPTFTLIQEYKGGRLPLYHVDLYRLTAREAGDLGLEELTSGEAIVAIEWAEKLEEPLAGGIRVRIADKGEDRREITIDWASGDGR